MQGDSVCAMRHDLRIDSMITSPMEKHRLRPTNRKLAIEAKCFDCIYDPTDGGLGTWRRQIAACQIKTCPLWHVRAKSANRRFNEDDEDVDDE